MAAALTWSGPPRPTRTSPTTGSAPWRSALGRPPNPTCARSCPRRTSPSSPPTTAVADRGSPRMCSQWSRALLRDLRGHLGRTYLRSGGERLVGAETGEPGVELLAAEVLGERFGDLVEPLERGEPSCRACAMVCSSPPSAPDVRVPTHPALPRIGRWSFKALLGQGVVPSGWWSEDHRGSPTALGFGGPCSGSGSPAPGRASGAWCRPGWSSGAPSTVAWSVSRSGEGASCAATASRATTSSGRDS